MVPGRGSEWNYVTVVHDGPAGRVKCKLWDEEFAGGASRIRWNILKLRGNGVTGWL